MEGGGVEAPTRVQTLCALSGPTRGKKPHGAGGGGGVSTRPERAEMPASTLPPAVCLETSLLPSAQLLEGHLASSSARIK